MKRMMLLGGLLLLAGTAGADISASTDGAAETGFAFLKISRSAHSGAMGESGSALYTDVFSGLHNPALMADTEQPVFAVTNNDWILDASQVSLAAGFSLWKARVRLGLGVLEVDDFELRETPVPDPQGTFSLQDISFTVAAGMPLSHGLSAGLSLNRLHEKIYNQDSGGYSFDLGLAWQGGPWGAAVLVKHLGSVDPLDGEDVELPQLLQAGASWTGKLPALETPVKAAADFLSYDTEDARVHLGFEASPLAALRLRGGILSGYDNRSFTWGFGLLWRNLKLDYANTPFDEDFDDTHKFTFSFRI